MPTTDPGSEHRLRFQRREEILNGQAETELKHRYGRGIYVNNIHEASTGELVISLGNTVPKNVSDSLEQDRVMRFVNIRDIYTLRGEPTGSGYYIVDLPDRDDVYNGFLERQQQILDRLDWSMAKAIYEDVFELRSVKTVLNPIIQIVRWVRKNPGITVERIDNAQGSDNTMNYLAVLSNLEFLWIENGQVYQGEGMDAVDLADSNTDDYVKTVVGQIIQDGYNVLQNQYDLGILAHYPKYSNAYYYSALQRSDSDLHLDVETIAHNYNRQYNMDEDPLVVGDKLDELSKTRVITKDGDYVHGEKDVYDQVSREAPVY